MSGIKLLHINCSNMGSTGKIIDSINRALEERGDKGFLCYELGCDPRCENEYKISFRYESGIYRRINYWAGYPYAFAPLSTAKLWRKIKEVQPDIIHFHCPNGNAINLYELLKKIKAEGIPIVLTHHCEMFYTGACPHSYDCKQWMNGCKNCKHLEYVGPYHRNRVYVSWRKLYEAMRGNRITAVSVSRWVYERSVQSPILKEAENVVILNGVNCNRYSQVRYDIKLLRTELDIAEDERCVLFVTSNFNTDIRNIKLPV